MRPGRRGSASSSRRAPPRTSRAITWSRSSPPASTRRPGAPYLVMELLRGEELADVAGRVGPAPARRRGRGALAGRPRARAGARPGHRPPRPQAREHLPRRRPAAATSPFTAKILDFGIAKLVEDSRQKTGTQPLGTPLFMSPEQTDRKGRICPATDVWALGLITFRLLTGRDFWIEADGSLADAAPRDLRRPHPLRVARERARELGRASTLPPPGFDAWFARCVTRDIDARFQDAGEAVRAFAELVTARRARAARSRCRRAPATGRRARAPRPPGSSPEAPPPGRSPSARAGGPLRRTRRAPPRPRPSATGDAAQRAATGASMVQATRAPSRRSPRRRRGSRSRQSASCSAPSGPTGSLGGASSAPPPAASSAAAATHAAGRRGPPTPRPGPPPPRRRAPARRA